MTPTAHAEGFEQWSLSFLAALMLLLRIVARLLRDSWLQLAALRCRMRCEGAAKSLIYLTPFPDPTNQGVVGSIPASRARNQGLARENQVLHVTVGPLWDSLSTGVFVFQPFATRRTVRVSWRLRTRFDCRSNRPTSALA